LDSPNWNRRQFYTVTRVDRHNHAHVLARHLACPPCNIGPLSTPSYETLADAAVHHLSNGRTVFAGQRAEGFFVDLGSIFDLATLRPFQQLHLGGGVLGGSMPGVNTTDRINVSSIAIRVPISDLTRGGYRHPDRTDSRAVIGVWTSASRRQVKVRKDRPMHDVTSGRWSQVSRLGNPLFNEVIVPMSRKDEWNQLPPSDDKQFADFVAHPELARLLPVLYPHVFPNLAALDASGKARADLVAILLTGIPKGVIPGFQNNTGSVLADMLRLNTAIPPSHSPNDLGVLGGDLAGFPNGRRPKDDVVTIELRAIAGLTFPLVDPTFTPDAAVKVITDGLTAKNVTAPFLHVFPYLGVPYDGYHNPSNP
jgi:hypothetical protein